MSSKRNYGQNLQVIGVTGGIGGGKTTVLDILAGMGVYAIRADDVAHDMILPGTRAYRQIVDHFGDRILRPDREIDRGKLAQIVFGNPADLTFLNSVVHPPVIDQLRRKFTALAVSGEPATVAVEIPLLVEAGLVDLVDTVMLVTAPRDVRIRRMIGQGWSEDKVLAVMDAQAADAEKAKFADVVVDNSTDLDSLRERVTDALAEVAGVSDAR